MELLIDTLKPWLEQQGAGYVGGNMFVYFSLAQVEDRYFRGPDVFVVLDVPPGERKSWVVWQEGKGPDLVIELLSRSTAEKDKNEKKIVYENELKVAEYFWFDPFDPDDWAGFGLVRGRYEPLALDAQSRYVSRRLGLALIRWRGRNEGVEATWLRWATLDGDLLLSSAERAEQAERQFIAATVRAEQAEQQRVAATARAEQAEQQRVAAMARAEQAERRAAELEAELARLKALPKM
jgi:Uma2 family endonuclease